MSESAPEPSTSTSIVPLEKGNIENAATVTGGILGFVLAGPLGGLVLAAISSYVSKKETDSGEALRGLGKTVIESVNFLSKINSKYGVADAVVDSLGQAVTKLESNSEAVGTIKKTVESTTSKVKNLNDEFDLISKGKEAIVVAKSLSDAAFEKVEELNAKVLFQLKREKSF